MPPPRGSPGPGERRRRARRATRAGTARDLASYDIFCVWLIPLGPGNQHLVGGGLEGEAETEQALEGGGGVVPAVEPEDELVEVGLEVLLAQAVVDPQRPPLGV